MYVVLSVRPSHFQVSKCDISSKCDGHTDMIDTKKVLGLARHSVLSYLALVKKSKHDYLTKDGYKANPSIQV